MTLHARDIMVRNFDTVHIEDPVEKAIKKISNSAVRETGYKTVSVMVVNDLDKLCGVVTIFDILYHLRPNFLNYGVDGEEFEWEGQLESLVNVFQGKKVHQVMTRHVVGAKEGDHIMVLLDRMVKNKYHRLPVLQNDKLIGIVYISDIFHHLFSKKV